MAVTALAFNMTVMGTNPGDFYYTSPAVMAMSNGVHVAITCISFTGSGQIDVWVQTSDDLENWLYLGGGSGTPPSTSLLSFTAPAAKEATVASTSAVGTYSVPVGALWVRFVFRVTGGSSPINGVFAVRANSFAD
jgi:hypothetical protein